MSATAIMAVLDGHHLYAPDYDDGISDVCQCGFELSPDGVRDNEPRLLDLEHRRHVAGLIVTALERVERDGAVQPNTNTTTPKEKP